MTLIRKQIASSQTGQFIADIMSLQNYWFSTADSGIVTVYFKPDIEDMSKDYSKYDSVAVSTVTGRVTLCPFFEDETK